MLWVLDLDLELEFPIGQAMRSWELVAMKWNGERCERL